MPTAPSTIRWRAPTTALPLLAEHGLGDLRGIRQPGEA